MTTTPDNAPGANQTSCPFCAGTGQIAGFRGVSRFVLSWEECPACSGSGISDPVATTVTPDPDHRKPPSAD